METANNGKSTEEELAGLIDAQIEAGLISCAACGSVGGTTLCRGNRRPLSPEAAPVDDDSIFEIASVSKLFVASIAAILHCEGRLDIDAPFTEYLPEHTLAATGTDVTVRDLATHTSGFDDAWMARAGVYSQNFPFDSDDKYLDAFLNVLPSVRRGERYRYSCHNFILLGLVIEKILGMDLETAARKYLWNPLGMNGMSWRDRTDDPRTVQMYTNGARPLGTKGDENARGLSRPIGNAGVFASLRSMLRFADDMLNRRVFPKGYYDLLFARSADFGVDRRSFGWNMTLDGIPDGWSESTIFHTGYTGQIVAVDPRNGKAGVVLTNLTPSDRELRAAAYAARRRMLALVCR